MTEWRRPPVKVPGFRRRRLLRFIDFIRGRYVSGLLVLAPFIITYLVVAWVYNFAADIVQPLFVDWFGHRIPGLGAAILILGPLLIGTAALYVLGRRVFYQVETLVVRIPVVGSIFGIANQLVSSLAADDDEGFSRVVEIEYPRSGMWAIGFLTSIVKRDGEDVGIIYIPTAPTPNSGWMAIVPLSGIRDVDITVTEAMRYVLSAGLAAPDDLRRGPPLAAIEPTAEQTGN